MSQPDYILDLKSQRVAGASTGGPGGTASTTGANSPAASSSAAGGSSKARPWIAVQWKCCQTYSRIYRNKTGTAYEGRCPKCGSPVRASVGQGGTSNRFFEAG